VSTGERDTAPWLVLGSMLAVALISLLVVLIYDCRRQEPYLDPEPIQPGDPGRVPPPPPTPE
jgi:hypothetical protein